MSFDTTTERANVEMMKYQSGRLATLYPNLAFPPDYDFSGWNNELVDTWIDYLSVLNTLVMKDLNDDRIWFYKTDLDDTSKVTFFDDDDRMIFELVDEGNETYRDVISGNLKNKAMTHISRIRLLPLNAPKIKVYDVIPMIDLAQIIIGDIDRQEDLNESSSDDGTDLASNRGVRKNKKKKKGKTADSIDLDDDADDFTDMFRTYKLSVDEIAGHIEDIVRVYNPISNFNKHEISVYVPSDEYESGHITSSRYTLYTFGNSLLTIQAFSEANAENMEAFKILPGKAPIAERTPERYARAQLAGLLLFITRGSFGSNVSTRTERLPRFLEVFTLTIEDIIEDFAGGITYQKLDLSGLLNVNLDLLPEQIKGRLRLSTAGNSILGAIDGLNRAGFFRECGDEGKGIISEIVSLPRCYINLHPASNEEKPTFSAPGKKVLLRAKETLRAVIRDAQKRKKDADGKKTTLLSRGPGLNMMPLSDYDKRLESGSVEITPEELIQLSEDFLDWQRKARNNRTFCS